MKKIKSITLTMRITSSMHTRLNAIAAGQNISVSALVRGIIKNSLARNDFNKLELQEFNLYDDEK
jgi:predicted HicB family RNase H-like nuclease